MLIICGAEGGVASVKGALTSDTGLMPTSFVAVAKQAYMSPLVSPEIVMGDVGLVFENPTRLALKHKTVYSVIGESPSSAALTLTEACPLLVTMLVITGASGAMAATATGVTATALEATLSPAAFTAISDIEQSVWRYRKYRHKYRLFGGMLPDTTGRLRKDYKKKP